MRNRLSFATYVDDSTVKYSKIPLQYTTVKYGTIPLQYSTAKYSDNTPAVL